jgi:uncharacterized protein YunC (DUF1805 family)
MIHKKVQIAGKPAEVYEIPLGPVNLVFTVTEKGMIGCGAFNVMVLDKYGYPSVSVKSMDGSLISGVDDLLAGEVREANEAAMKLGVKEGMPAREAAELL